MSSREIAPPGIVGTYREIRGYFTREDRRQWAVLFVLALVGGAAQSLILATFNDAVAAYGKGRALLPYIPALLVLMAVATLAGYAGAVRGHLISGRMAVGGRPPPP
ncbi:MAG: hypothetical protein AB1452_17435, partial [Pseudomonadota bacterium]